VARKTSNVLPVASEEQIALPLTTKEERESELASSILEIGWREANFAGRVQECY